MAPAGASGSPLLYSDFQYIRFSKSGPAANSSVSGDTAAQVSGRRKVQFAVLGLLRNHRNSGQAALASLPERTAAERRCRLRRDRPEPYVHYEEYGKDLYPPEHMEKIAQLFEVPVDMLLDDYNLFLRNGQGEQIKAIRTKLGLTQRQYADKLGVSLGNLKHWEQNRKQIFKSTWEKYFRQT